MKVSTKVDLKKTPEFRILNGNKETIVQERIGPSIYSPPRECSTFYFSPAKLAELKKLASSSDPSDPWVSTHDALCGLLWRRISLARCLSSNDAEDGQSAQVQFACAVQGRQRLSPPLTDDYLGIVSFYCSFTLEIENLVSPSVPLYTVARTVRTALAKFDDARLREAIAVIDSVSNISHLEITCYDDPERSLGLSSWADMGLYELDWGRALGRPDRVRVLKQPSTGAVGGGAIFPRLPDGGLEVILGIEVDAMKRLRADAEFVKFAEWRCT